MTAIVADAIDTPFEVLQPSDVTAPFVFNSPHSGQVYPRDFVEQARLDLATLRRSEDSFVDLLFRDVAETGMPFMQANFPRCYLDLNREPYELDPRMFDGRLPAYANTRSMRVSGGLGTIARIVGDSQEIYVRRLPVSEAIRRIEDLYKPYHRTLRQLLAKTHRQFGVAVLVDCHSMPSSMGRSEERQRADIIIGDRYGTSCSGAIPDAIEDALRARGYMVTRNKPYAGGFITEHYGNPAAGIHAVQIEVNRALYMDERTYSRGDRFENVRADMLDMTRQLAALALHELAPARTAAE